MKNLNLTFYQFRVPFVTVLISMFFISCSSNKLPGLTAAGSPGELLIVMQDSWLKGAIGEEVKEVFQSHVPGLPQVEPWMRLQTVSQDNYGQFLRNTRNILYIDNNDAIYSKVSVKYIYDPHARGQLLVSIQTPDEKSLRDYLQEYGRELCELFLRNELFRLAEDVVDDYSALGMDLCQKQFGYRINLPKDMLSYKKDKDFLWISNNAPRKRYDVVIFSIPYNEGKKLPNPKKLIAIRDSVLGKQIPGSHPESHMATSNYGGEYRIARIPGSYTFAELRGLWEMTPPDLMAGPMIVHVFADEAEKRLYYLEGFVYHPNENKRDLVRRIQAALFSFRPKDQENFDPEPIKRLQWGKVQDLTSETPTFADSL